MQISMLMLLWIECKTGLHATARSKFFTTKVGDLSVKRGEERRDIHQHWTKVGFGLWDFRESDHHQNIFFLIQKLEVFLLFRLHVSMMNQSAGSFFHLETRRLKVRKENREGRKGEGKQTRSPSRGDALVIFGFWFVIFLFCCFFFVVFLFYFVFGRSKNRMRL